MGIFVIINGVTDPEIHDRVERYAFVDGIRTCNLCDYLTGGIREGETPAFFYADRDGFRQLQEQLANILYMRCPMVLIPTSQEELEELRRERKYPCDVAGYPFEREEFRIFRKNMIDPLQWENRTMDFGGLLVDRAGRQIYLKGMPLALTGYDYDIFLLLIEHLGDVVSREDINQILPSRKRTSLRNVDTHIKSIRKLLGTEDLIQSIRSVGYCIPAEGLQAGAGGHP